MSPVHSDQQPLFSAPQAGFSFICLCFIHSPCSSAAFAAALSESCHVQTNTVVPVVRARSEFRQTVTVMAYPHPSDGQASLPQALLQRRCLWQFPVFYIIWFIA